MPSPLASLNALNAGLVALMLSVGSGTASAAGAGLSLPEAQRNSSWYSEAQQELARAGAVKIDNTPGAAKNIILFVGDGMGISTVTAARILAGQQQGLDGEEYRLSFEQMPFAGLVKTYNTNQQTPDSAGTMSAIMTGVKTRAGMFGLPGDVPRGDCAASQGRGLVTALELAEAQGKRTGVVSTARITHATPAATYARAAERGWEYQAPEGCRDIAAQLVEFERGDGIEVVLGGGRRAFLPKEVTDLEGEAGRREDGRNLVQEWQQRYSEGAAYVEDLDSFAAVDPTSTHRLLGLFESSHMRYEADRGNDKAGEPSLTDMTRKALAMLERGEQGYFLMVEGGRIDHAHHAGSAHGALTDAVEFAEAVQLAMDSTSPEDTLIIVTADHSHVFTMAGYPTRGNPILGKVVGNDHRGEPREEPTLAADGKPYTTLGYANGRGFAHLGDQANADARYALPPQAGRVDLAEVDTTAPGFHQEALVPGEAETHGGEDVGIWARGPGAHLLSGTREQNYIFHVMARAGGLLDDKGSDSDANTSPSDSNSGASDTNASAAITPRRKR